MHSRNWCLTLATIALLICTLSIGSAQASDFNRNAIIIANGGYYHHDHVRTAKNDAIRMKEVLAQYGYEADDQYDLAAKPSAKTGTVGKPSLSATWSTFLSKVKGDAGMAIFYFTGHGVSIGGDSYLLPVDLPQGVNEAQIRSMGLSLKSIFQQFKDAQAEVEKDDERLDAIFIIDACRAALKNQTGLKTTGITGSLNPIVPPSGLFVIYAASHGQVAHSYLNGAECPVGMENANCPPSVFTRELVKLLDMKKQRNVRLQDLARKVRWGVFRTLKTKGDRLHDQTPDFVDRWYFDIDIAGEVIRKLPQGKSGKPPAPGLPDKPPVATTDNESPVANVPRDEPALVWECEYCPELIAIKPNTEPTGHQSGRADQHFAMGKSEVTRGQYRAYLTERTPSEGETKSCPKGHQACVEKDPYDPSRANNLNLPVTGISWLEAKAYVEWLNRSLGLVDRRKPENNSSKNNNSKKNGYYRLPTEFEWSVAARAGAPDGQRYVFGNDVSDLCQYGNGADASLKSFFLVNDKCDDGYARRAAQVMSYKPNAYGLHDVHGNVWEWVADCWSDEPPSSNRKNGKPGDTCSRVALGGSWRSSPESLELGSRTSFPQNMRRPTVGFRVLRVLAEDELAPVKTAAQ